jgi:hypothetical protein
MNPSHTVRKSRVAALASITTLALALAAPALAHAHRPPDPPRVPANLEVPAGHRSVRLGRATGTQNYVCLPAAAGGFAWTFFAPQATLFDGRNRQNMTHFLSPNPVESGTPRATWQDSEDTSAVWAVAQQSSSDPAFVATGAIPWLLLRVVGQQRGPTGGDELVRTVFIHRVNTVGGVAPSFGCAQSTDVGAKALVPYTADYFFYERTR